MLVFYSRVAKRLYGAKRAFWLVACAGIVAFVALIFMPDLGAGPTYAFLALTISLWSFFLIVVVNGFSTPIPVSEPGFSLFTRIRIKLRRAALLVSAVILTLTAATILSFTFRAVASLINL